MLNNRFEISRHNRFSRLVFGMVLFCSGCALQSSLVDLEEGVQTIQKRQQELLLLSEKLDAMNKTSTSSPTQAASLEGRAMLLEKINVLEEQLRVLEGRIEEEGRKGLVSMRTLDDQTHQVNLLPSRLDLLEKRVSALENKSGKADTPSQISPQSEGGGTRGEEKSEKGGVTERQGAVSPSEAYRLAYNDYLRGNYSLAVISFQNYIEQYPSSAFLPDAFYWLGESYYNQGQYDEAILFLEQVYVRYPTHEKVPSAKMKEARALISMKEPERAKALLMDVIDQYPQSNEAFRAKEVLAGLNNTSSPSKN